MQAGLAPCPRPRQPPQPGQAQPTLHVAPVAARGPAPAAAARSWFSQAGTPGGAGEGPYTLFQPQHPGGTGRDGTGRDRTEQSMQFRLLPSGGSTAPGSAAGALQAGCRVRAASPRPREPRSRATDMPSSVSAGLEPRPRGQLPEPQDRSPGQPQLYTSAGRAQPSSGAPHGDARPAPPRQRSRITPSAGHPTPTRADPGEGPAAPAVPRELGNGCPGDRTRPPGGQEPLAKRIRTEPVGAPTPG